MRRRGRYDQPDEGPPEDQSSGHARQSRRVHHSDHRQCFNCGVVQLWLVYFRIGPGPNRRRSSSTLKEPHSVQMNGNAAMISQIPTKPLVVSLHLQRTHGQRLLGTSFLKFENLVGPAGLEPATTPLSPRRHRGHREIITKLFCIPLCPLCLRGESEAGSTAGIKGTQYLFHGSYFRKLHQRSAIKA